MLERKLKDTQITPRKNTSLNQSALEALVTSNERCQSKSTLISKPKHHKTKEQTKTNKKRCKQEKATQKEYKNYDQHKE